MSSTADEWDRVVDINLKGTFLVCKHALGPMLESGSGSIVNIASIEGLEGVDGGSAYNASKGGVVLLTKNLAIDYGRRGIRVNCICPGLIDTPLAAAVTGNEAMRDFRERFVQAHHMGRMGRPEEIAAAALFLASDDASFVDRPLVGGGRRPDRGTVVRPPARCSDWRPTRVACRGSRWSRERARAGRPASTARRRRRRRRSGW